MLSLFPAAEMQRKRECACDFMHSWACVCSVSVRGFDCMPEQLNSCWLIQASHHESVNSTGTEKVCCVCVWVHGYVFLHWCLC